MSTIVLITAGKGLAILLALKPAPSASRHCPIGTLVGRYVCPCYARRYLFAPISNNLLFVKTSADYIITGLLDSMQVVYKRAFDAKRRGRSVQKNKKLKNSY